MLESPPYNFSDGSVGLTNLAALVGSLLGYLTSFFSDRIVIFFARRNSGVKEPEMRLWALIPCFVYTVVGYELYGWGPSTKSHWITVCLGNGGMIAQQVAASATVSISSIVLFCCATFVYQLILYFLPAVNCLRNGKLSRNRRGNRCHPCCMLIVNQLCHLLFRAIFS